MNEQNPETGITNKMAISGAVGIALVAFFAGVMVRGMAPTPAAAVLSVMGENGMSGVYAPPEGVDFSPVWKTWQVIDQYYVPDQVATTSIASSTPTGATDPQERVWGMVAGLAASLGDPYTIFLPPADAEIFEADIQGNFEGVGMEIAIRDGTLTVVSPLQGTPSYKAGVKAGDKILKIDDADTESVSVDVAVKRIRGPKGTTVKLTILREGEKAPLEISVVRDVINIPTIETETKDGVYVIKLSNFSAVSPGLFRDALRQFIESGSNKLVLDLRGNPGGYLEASVEMASWFLPSGNVVVTEDYADKKNGIVHRSRGYDIFNDNLKMVILVDRGSASASEILAGALQHYKVAQIVGTNTFGKGSVQELVDITSDSSLKITVARWLAPSGKQIPNDGITPDIEIKPTEEEIKEGRDPQFDKAVEILSEG